MFSRSEVTRRRSQHRYGRWSAPLAAAAVALVAAGPAQADPAVYVASSDSGKVYQYGINFIDGSLSPLA